MIMQIEKNKIIVEYAGGKSIRAIARDNHISRETVKKYIREYKKYEKEIAGETDLALIAAIQEKMCSKPERKKITKVKTAFTAEVEKRFNEIIEEYEIKEAILGTNKQNLTSEKIYKTLIEEGYKIGLSTVSNAYRVYKSRCRECFIRQDYDYGFRSEFDFHIIKLKVNNEIRKYHQVTIVAPKSNHVFELLYPCEKSYVVIESIIKYIDHCGGVFKEFVFDNMKTVVKQFFKNDKEYTDDIIKLSTYYGFKIFTCNARSGNEKGSVENAGKYTRNDFFSLKYEFKDEEELFKYHQDQLDKLNEKYKEEWEKEKAALLPKKEHDYIIQIISTCKVNTYSCICYNNNFYSVPDKYVGETVSINVYAEMIVIYYENIEIARHTIKKGFHEYQIVLDHYLNTFKRKPAALEHSLALKQAPEELRNIFNDNYNMNAKEFITDLIDGNLNKKERFDNRDDISELSTKQLEEISKFYEA